MIAKVMIDTNLLVYAYDVGEPVKQQQALKTLNYLTLHKLGALSTQVLAEFFVTATRKLKPPLEHDDALVRVNHLVQVWTVFNVKQQVVLEAIRGVRDYQLSYWDAQVWAVARLNQVSTILSEDFNTDAVIEGVRFINPFAMTLPIEDWLQ